MSLNKAIESGKEHRKPYRGAKSCDPMCRNHGGCKWCEDGRLYRYKKAKLKGTGGEEDVSNNDKD